MQLKCPLTGAVAHQNIDLVGDFTAEERWEVARESKNVENETRYKASLAAWWSTVPALRPDSRDVEL